MTPCPTADCLDHWVNEQLPAAAADAVAAHVESCRACQAVLEALMRPTELSAPAPPPAGDPHAMAFVERLKAHGPGTTLRHPGAAERREPANGAPAGWRSSRPPTRRGAGVSCRSA